MSSRCFIGTSGWAYKHWAQGVFYPKGLKQSEWLGFYAQHFNTVEINATFYRLPPASVFRKWREATPDGFAISVKASRLITHVRRLAGAQEAVAQFLENARELGDKLGVILFQLPPSLRFAPELLEPLLEQLKRQEFLPSWRAALEVRHKSWLNDDCFQLLAAYNVSLALTDWRSCPTDGPATADFVYVRRHGPGKLYASSYSDQALKDDAGQIRAWLDAGKDVYIYFNNDFFGYAIQNAQTLQSLLQANPDRRS
jgi:uncharacterized protein YecE (DUF72 family)